MDGESRENTPNQPLLLEEEAAEAVAAFLVEKPLYSLVTIAVRRNAMSSVLTPGVIRRRCPSCAADTNWKQTHLVTHGSSRGQSLALGRVIAYTCVQCDDELFTVWFEVKFSAIPAGAKGDDVVGSHYKLRKLGQWEPWSIRPDPALEKELTKTDRELYRRALMNMSSGFGLGAVAYFRRIIENETGRLLDVVYELAEAEGHDELLEELEKARKGHNLDERLRLAAAATPRSLKLGEMNPLKLLYEHMSANLHAGSEEECLAIAEELRATFEFVFRHVRDTLEQRRELARVLTKRRGPPAGAGPEKA